MENTNIIVAIICLLGAMVLIAFVFVFVSIRIVPADKRLSVHRLGQYIGDRGPGIVILIPFIDRGVMKEAVTLEESPFSD